MSKNQKVTKFEFLLTLEGQIICQRYFNVEDHNPASRRSLDLHDYVKQICDEISHDLKIKSSDFIYHNQNFIWNNDNVEKSNVNKYENYLLEIKIGDEVFIQRIFPAHYYHPMVRYTVDIRPMLKRFLSELTDILSSEEVVTTYLDYELN